MTLAETYDIIKRKYEKYIDSFKVVESVENHRNFWKPKKIKIILLAESHVFTKVSDHNHILNYSTFENLEGCPTNFVKLVYCLGYGETNLADIQRNYGTPQFWKIFVSCVDKNQNFNKILISKTINCQERLNNKIFILEKLKEHGIWLLDASIVGLYNNNNKPSQKIMREIINISWDNHISHKIKEVNPEKIIVIGKGVLNILNTKLQHIENIEKPFYQPQPQARLSKEQLEKTFNRYYEFCN